MLTTLTRSFVTFAALLASAAALAQAPPTFSPTDRLSPVAADCTENCTGQPFDPLYDFGSAVALWDDSAFVGIPGQSRVAVFRLNPVPQAWERQGTLEATDRQAGDGFGRSIATSKYKTLIGANGAAYVFGNSAAQWIQATKLQPSTADAAFGSSVAYWGSTAVVGAPSDSAAGSVYVYQIGGDGQVVATTVLTAPDGFAGDHFGAHVAVQNRTLLVSGTGSSTGGRPTVYIYEGSGASWSPLYTALYRDPGDSGRFGASLAIVGSTYIVGSPPAIGETGGHVYTYIKISSGPGGGVHLDQTLTPPPPTGPGIANFGFGNSLAIDSNGRLAVATTWGPQPGTDQRGLVYVYDFGTSGYVLTGRALYGGETAQMALSGSTLLAGFVQSRAQPFTARGYANALTVIAEGCERTAPIAIDGNPADWAGVPKQAVSAANLIEGSVTSLADSSATFRVQWDNANLYVLVEVLDDALRGTSSGVYNNDSVELYLDGGNEGAGSYDANDHQLTVDWRGVRGGVNGSISYTSAVTTNATGYVVEYSIPWSQLGAQGVIPANHRIGVDVAINDNDSGTEQRDSQIVWHGDGTGWLDPSTFAEYYLSLDRCGGVIGICARSRPLTIDGNGSDWQTGFGNVLSIGPNDAVVGSPPITWSTSIQLQWDSTNLYVYTLIGDRTVGANTGAVYDNDGFELYVDGGNEHSTTYDSNDFQLTVDRNGTHGGVHSQAVQFQSAVREATYGYALEYSVPWAQLGVTATATTHVGLDFAVNDATTGATVRDSQMVWHGNGEGWFDTRTFGHFVLDSSNCP